MMDKRFTPDIILLAAGFGKRMMPLTSTTPKPLVKVGGEALLDRVIANCMAEGCTNFAINAHYLFDQMVAHISDLQTRFPNAQLHLSEERETLLDTGGGAKKALGLVKSDPILVMNTDAFWPAGSDTPIARMQAEYANGAEIVLLCAHPARAAGFRRSHDFCLAPDKKITNDRGAPVIYTGAALISRAVFDNVPEGPFSLLDLLYAAEERGTLHGVLLNAPWLHVGDPEALAEAEAILAGSRA